MVSLNEHVTVVLEPTAQIGNPPVQHEKLETRRRYKEWKGKNKILFAGRIIGGSEVGKLFRTLALVGIPGLLFAIFVGGPYWTRYNEYHVIIVGAILTFLSISTLLKTAFMDPGIIPRSNNTMSEARKFYIPPRYQDICMDGRTVRLKFCKTCKIFRPPRSFHCPICDNCVERFDHHCPWIGTCIGLRNYGWFSSFIWTTTAVCSYVLSYSLMLLLRIGREFTNENLGKKISCAIRNEPIAAFLVVYTFLAIWFVLGLCLFHTYLVSINQTTNEKLRGLYEFGSAYSLGLVGNMQTLCCMIPESAVHIHHEEPVPTAELEEIQKKTVMYVHSLADPGLNKKDSTGNTIAELKVGDLENATHADHGEIVLR